MERTCEFLGISPLAEFPPRLTTHKKPKHPKRDMPDWFRADLANRYREDSERLLELAPDFDLSLWKNYASPVAPGRVESNDVAAQNGSDPIGAVARDRPQGLDRQGHARVAARERQALARRQEAVPGVVGPLCAKPPPAFRATP